jgi:hypothetical protein
MRESLCLFREADETQTEGSILASPDSFFQPKRLLPVKRKCCPACAIKDALTAKDCHFAVVCRLAL